MAVPLWDPSRARLRALFGRLGSPLGRPELLVARLGARRPPRPSWRPLGLSWARWKPTKQARQSYVS
eukprot:5768545-Pyramimonas_sp.AAC.1